MSFVENLAQEMLTTSVVPVALIPACALLALTFNNRIMFILNLYAQLQDKYVEVTKELIGKTSSNSLKEYDQPNFHQSQTVFKARIGIWDRQLQLLRYGIFFEYSAIFFFCFAAMGTVLGAMNPHLLLAAGIMLIIGIFLAVIGLIFTVREILISLVNVDQTKATVEHCESMVEQAFKNANGK